MERHTRVQLAPIASQLGLLVVEIVMVIHV